MDPVTASQPSAELVMPHAAAEDVLVEDETV